MIGEESEGEVIQPTDGPWEVSDTSIVSPVCSICIAVIETDGDCAAPSDERRANSILLAASWEMLRVIRECEGLLDESADLGAIRAHELLRACLAEIDAQ
jgi:hypothetical protein